MDLLASNSWELTGQVLGIVFFLSPIWLPILLFYVFGKLWMNYIRTKFIQDAEFILLEIKLPRDITRSPAAMELVLSAFWQSDPANTFIKRLWEGKIMDWFSLEMMSIGGEVHFFIWTNKKYKNVVESRIYAQYPNIEIYEVPDYTQFIEFDPNKNNIWATDYQLKKPDPYPIMTYIDYGLDKDPKEEFKIDPLSALIEYLGSIQPGEQVWHQIIVRKHVKHRGRKSFFRATDWQQDAKDLVSKIKSDIAAGTGEAFEKIGSNITEGQKKVISAIERSTAKNAYEVGIRSIYIADNEVFNHGPNISGLFGSFFQVNSNDLNGFEAGKMTDFKYPWQDYKEIRMNRMRKEFFDAYRARGYFHYPYKKKWFILNTEELATIYHFPGDVVQTPTFGRIGSRKAEPPTNLPV